MIQPKLITETEEDASIEDAAPHAPAAPRTSFLWLTTMILAAVGIFAGLFLMGYLPLQRREEGLAAEAAKIASALPRVSVAKPRRAPSITELTLPGTVQAFQETTIYPRATGTLKRWLVDIGDEVQDGQLLAEIAIPEIDQQLNQARAAVAQSRARLSTAQAQTALAESTLKRYEGVTHPGGISEQELAERRATVLAGHSAVEVAKADVFAAEASILRLSELQSFSKVLAPFAGTVTARNIEAGTVVVAGNSKPEGLFRIAQTDPLRIFVNVPQMDAPTIKPGQDAEVLVREFQGRKFPGKVARTSKEIDAVSRTLMTEIDVQNKDKTLLTGMYAQVKLAIERDQPPLLIPGSSLIVNAAGTQVAVIDQEKKIHFQKIELDRDYGNEIGIGAGLDGEEWIVANPGQRLIEGGVVDAIYPQAADAKKVEAKKEETQK